MKYIIIASFKKNRLKKMLHVVVLLKEERLYLFFVKRNIVAQTLDEKDYGHAALGLLQNLLQRGHPLRYPNPHLNLKNLSV